MSKIFVLVTLMFELLFLNGQARGTFPYEMSVLDVPTELEWNVQVLSLNIWPLSLCDDGLVLYYR